MGLKYITTDELKQKTKSEGLILQGCGGNPQEWVDGINEMLAEHDILLNGAKFTDISIFQNNGVTNIMFGMDDMSSQDLDIGKLTVWRIKTHEQFGGTWLSDYLPNQLGVTYGEIEEDSAKVIAFDGWSEGDAPRQSLFTVYIENVQHPEIGGFTISLPTTAEQLRPWIEGIEAADLGADALVVKEIRSSVPRLAERIPIEVSLNELNYLAVKMDAMSNNNKEIFAAAIEADMTAGSLAEIINLTENLDCFDLQPVYDAAGFGEFLVQMDGENLYIPFERLEASIDPKDRALAKHIEHLEKFIDFEAYGKDAAERDGGVFTEQGYIVPVKEVCEVYRDERDIPAAFTLFQTTKPITVVEAVKQPPLIMLQNVDLAATLLEMHGVGGEYMRDAKHNLQTLANGGSDYFVMLNPHMLTISRAEDVYHKDTTEHELWMMASPLPENRAFVLSVTENGGGHIIGNVYEIEIAAFQDSTMEYGFYFSHFDAEMKDGTNRLITLDEWDAMDQFERGQLKSWTKIYDPMAEARLNTLVRGIRLTCEEYCQPIAVSTFLSQISEPFMAQAVNPQPNMLRIAHETAREMLAMSAANVCRLLKDGIEQLSAIDAAKTGLWFSVDREFAVLKKEFVGVEKWAQCASAEILRQIGRCEHQKEWSDHNEL